MDLVPVEVFIRENNFCRKKKLDHINIVTAMLNSYQYNLYWVLQYMIYADNYVDQLTI